MVRQRVFVGLSGGVDSSLAAALLVEQGYEVTGVYMRNWSVDLPGYKCPWAEDLADCERVAVALGINLQVWDYEKQYKHEVVDYLVESYARGLTPNPDVMCNEKIKFGVFAQRAFSEGADYVATGHYARVAAAAAPGQPARLMRAADEWKDQTYFLWRVSGAVLTRVLFPIGEFASKDDVRAAAAERELVTAEKPDSTGICFIGPVGIQQFLATQIERRPGDVVELETGKVLGRHEGACQFTVGQRRGLDLGGGPARYVVKTDIERNIVYVTADKLSPALWCSELVCRDLSWVAGCPPAAGQCLVRSRHTQPLRAAQVRVDADGGELVVRFPEPVKRIACGQSVVLYSGKECLGGGILADWR